jgi:hypothetical protein
MEGAEHSHHSSQREAMLEDLFVGEVMRRMWLAGIYDLEVLKPQVDDSGYDLVFETNSIVRHVQLKSTMRESKVQGANVHLRLAGKPSGCVIVVEFDREFNLGPFYWFGGAPGERLPDILSLKVARHTKANSQGQKNERPDVRVIPRSKFLRVATVGEVVDLLFGSSVSGSIRRSTPDNLTSDLRASSE